jgi:hypothetical protein
MRIFVRQRPHTQPGTRRPRFAIVAVEGGDLRFYRPSLRRRELEQIGEVTGAEIVYLSGGEGEHERGSHHHQ